MKTIYTIIFTVIFSMMLENIQAKNNLNQGKSLVINLAEINPGSIKVLKEARNNVYDSIKLENAVVGYKYSINIDKERTEIPVLTFSKIIPSGQKGKDTVICAEMTSAIKMLENAYSETGREQYFNNYKKQLDEVELSKRIDKLQKMLFNKVCDNDSLNNLAKQRIEQSNQSSFQNISVESGETVTITIKRDTITWTYILKGESLGKWVTTYGFGFTSSALGGNTYYSKQMPDTTLYKILKSNNTGNLDLNYIPAIFFSYFPTQNFNKCWNHSLTAGLGFDLSAPVVFFGYNGMFWQNLGFSLGVAFQQQYRLKNQYTENEIIKSDLTIDQLHDKVYRPNLFVAVNFRFGENPFKTSSEK